MLLPIVIPAKNEAGIIEKTIKSIQSNIEHTDDIQLFIVVVDDGSSDETAQIAKKTGAHVVSLPDRGYSALGKPELANTVNAGFEYIDQYLGHNSYEFLMVCGADIILHKNYIQLLLEEMQNDSQLALCAGMHIGYKTNSDAVRGSGRIIRNDFWTLLGRKYPNQYYSWESYPIVYANAHGFSTKTIYNATFSDSRDREPLSLVDWKNYGIGMKERGSIPLYVLGRAIKRILAGYPYSAYRLLYGYFFSKNINLYDQELRNYIKKKEWSTILNLGKR